MIKSVMKKHNTIFYKICKLLLRRKNKMKNLNLKNRVVNIFLTLLVFMATAGANNFSLSGMYQPQKPDRFKF